MNQLDFKQQKLIQRKLNWNFSQDPNLSKPTEQAKWSILISASQISRSWLSIFFLIVFLLLRKTNFTRQLLALSLSLSLSLALSLSLSLSLSLCYSS